MSAPRVIVLDFDGTMTDAEAEGAPFRTGYLQDLATLCGTTVDDPRFAAIVASVEESLRAAPEAHPFRWKGRPVAPASVDPYLRMVPIADALFDDYGLIPDRAFRGRLTGGVLYKHNYGLTKGKPVFRPGAAEVLRALTGTETYVVTNSDTAAVAAKIAMLDATAGGVGWLAARVRGDAQKFEVDDAWEGAPPSLAIPGLRDREVLLRRRRYHDRLAAILDAAGATFADLVVIGDIFELDLALPLALGARVGLVASEHTPPYELEFVGAQPRARVLRELAEIPAFLGLAS
jgi:hypothetical protein